ncbi:MAG: hypothetical protein LBN39_05775, partial [Planctomycetaceae bacterium]|nr:hypothetical protein [Planctomycetaceae bacterium]
MKKNISLVLLLVLSACWAGGQLLYGQAPAVPAPATPAPQPAAEAAKQPEPATPPPPAAGASEKPAEPAPPAEPPKPYDPQKSLVRLQHPAVAARLGLTDEQRAEVQRLVALKGQELANTPEDQWTKIHEESDKKLFAVLTQAQQTYLPKLFSERTIRFIFKMQAWADVLQWFAEQAGLQLVMDAPPPGQFNYADQRDYTPSEAIDLLNSVLQTKGYTLVRNDKMLMLFNLRRGAIPVQFLPKLKPEELKERGMFEYTTVMFPLERRDRTEVLELLKPFKGQFCHIDPMPGNSLMITDTAGNLQVLQKVIESVANPPVPPPPQPAPPAPPAVWRSYVVEKNDPAKIEEIFKEFSPNAKILRIGNSNKLHIHLKQDEQANLETVLKMLEEDSGVTQGELVLTSYSLSPYLNSPQQFWRLNRFRRTEGFNGQQQQQQQYPYRNPFDSSLSIGKEIIDVLKKTFPAAVVSDTPVAENIVVLTTKEEHEKIKQFFDELKQTTQPEDEMAAKLYKFSDPKKKMTEETLKQFRGIVPAAVMTLDEDKGQILIVASVKEQELLAQAFKELEAAVLPEEDKKIVSYRMPVSTATRFSTMLKQMTGKHEELENIVELRDTKQGFITVWATEKQHTLIQNLYNEVTGHKTAAPGTGNTLKQNEPVLRAYPMVNGYAYTAHTVLDNMITGADFSYDPRTNSIIAVAPPDLQEIVAKAVEELDKNVPEDVAFITLKRELPADMMRQFNRVAPHCVAVQNRRSLQIILTGPKAELDKIKAILTAAEAAEEKNEEVVVQTLQTASPSMVVSLLEDIF